MNHFLEKPLNIAIVGTGISGLGIANLLYPHHNIKIGADT
jgi:predicted NAD/FAD-binding protein